MEDNGRDAATASYHWGGGVSSMWGRLQDSDWSYVWLLMCDSCLEVGQAAVYSASPTSTIIGILGSCSNIVTLSYSEVFAFFPPVGMQNGIY